MAVCLKFFERMQSKVVQIPVSIGEKKYFQEDLQRALKRTGFDRLIENKISFSA